MHCELMAGCLFFNALHQDQINALKDVYCKNNPVICARRQVAMAVGRERVPQDLTPNHTHRVQGIVDAVLSGR
ncbi:MAG: hypothetical protein WCG03_10840 [Kiritimatiellales bacterium]